MMFLSLCKTFPLPGKVCLKQLHCLPFIRRKWPFWLWTLLHHTLWWWPVFMNQICPCHRFHASLMSVLLLTLAILDLESLHSQLPRWCFGGQAAEVLHSQHGGTVLSVCTGTKRPYLQDWSLAQRCGYLNRPRSSVSLKHSRLKCVPIASPACFIFYPLFDNRGYNFLNPGQASHLQEVDDHGLCLPDICDFWVLSNLVI